jgi:hypothetical protein
MVAKERNYNVGVVICKCGYEGLVIGTGGHDGEAPAGRPIKPGESVGMIGGMTMCIVETGVKGSGDLWESGEEVCYYV